MYIMTTGDRTGQAKAVESRRFILGAGETRGRDLESSRKQISVNIQPLDAFSSLAQQVTTVHFDLYRFISVLVRHRRGINALSFCALNNSIKRFVFSLLVSFFLCCTGQDLVLLAAVNPRKLPLRIVSLLCLACTTKPRRFHIIPGRDITMQFSQLSTKGLKIERITAERVRS